MKKTLQSFLLTLAVFVGGWKISPNSIIAEGYGTCVLATVVFTAAAIVSLLIGIVLFIAFVAKFGHELLATIVFYLFCITITPFCVFITTQITNYTIIGKSTFAIFSVALIAVSYIFSSDKVKTTSKATTVKY